MTDLERKGLGVHQLLGLELPGDLTLDEARAAIKQTEAWQVIIGTAAEPDQVEMYFGWRTDGAHATEDLAPDHITIDQWKAGSNPFISINDGSGGLRINPTPVLQDA